MSGAKRRSYRDVGEPDDADWYWIQAGEACAKLLARLTKRHAPKQTARRRQAEAPLTEGDGSG